MSDGGGFGPTEPDAPGSGLDAGRSPRRLRLGFREWRRSRPFWAGLWCLLGGALIAFGPATAIRFVLVSGTIVSVGILVGVVVLLMGLFLWFLPQNRHIAGVLAIAFSMASFVTSNLGGFIVGMALGVLGGAMGFAWTPRPAEAPPETPGEPPSTRPTAPSAEQGWPPVDGR
jgi:uncharacterized protein DUF6114